MLMAASYFWSFSANAFIFGLGAMTITLEDIFMMTGLNITPSNFSGLGEKKIGKILDFSNWPNYIKHFSKTTKFVDPTEHVDFLNMLLEKFVFYGASLGPTFN